MSVWYLVSTDSIPSNNIRSNLTSYVLQAFRNKVRAVFLLLILVYVRTNVLSPE